jgi:hypothetical protein
MDDADIFGDIDMMDILPLIAIAAAQGSRNLSNAPTRSIEGVMSGADFLRELLNYGNKKRIYGVLRMLSRTQSIEV